MTTDKACPHCGAAITVNEGYEPWCPECGWGCDNPKPPADDAFSRIYRSLGQKMGERLFLDLKNNEDLLQKPRLTPAIVLAHVVAAPVHLITIALFVAGVWFLTVNWFHFVPFTIGLLLIAAAYALRPRFGKAPKHRLNRQDAPALFGLVDDVAESLGTRTIDEIYIEPELNGSFGRYGLRQTRFMMLGSPLWQSLDGAGKTALVAHELAHQVNGDFARNYWMHTAIHSLQVWLDFLWQPHMGDEGASVLTHYLFLILSVPIYLLLYTLVHLYWRESQRAEYLADYLGSRVSGSSAYVASDEHIAALTIHAGELFEKTRKHALDPDRIVPEFVSRFAVIPPLEMERVRRIMRQGLLTLDSTHPPSYFRCRLVEAFPCPPAVVVSEDQSNQMNQEVAALDTEMGKALVRQNMIALS